MARFYFDLVDGAKSVIDRNGDNLEDVEEARREAARVLGEAMHDAMPDGEGRTLTVNVREEGGSTVLRLKMEMTVDRL